MSSVHRNGQAERKGEAGRAGCLSSSSAWHIAAQAQFRTSIQGVVTDTTGAVVPGATLTLKNNGTNETIDAEERSRRRVSTSTRCPPPTSR